MKKLLLTFVLLCGIAGVGLYVFGLPAAQKKEAAPPPPRPVQEVSILLLEKQAITLQHSLPGRVTAFRQSVVRPQVEGIITRRMFEEGAEVKKGQQLYQIDDTRYQAILGGAVADVRSAQANLKAAQARAKRYGELVKKNAISRQDNDDAIAALGQAQAAIGIAQAKVDLAKIDVGYTKVYAPISGRIGRSYISEGALVTANQAQELATITVLNPVYVDMQQSAGDQAVTDIRAELARNTHVPVHLILEHGEGENQYEHTGQLKFFEVTMDKTTASTTLRAEIPNPDGYLLPGMFVRAVLDLGKKEVLLVPQRATTRTAQGDLKVWIVNAENKVQQRTITADAAYQDSWIVSEGLQAGESLIVEGYQKVQPDQQVNTVAWQNPSTVKPSNAEGN